MSGALLADRSEKQPREPTMAAGAHNQHLRPMGLCEQRLRGVALSDHNLNSLRAFSAHDIDNLLLGDVAGALPQVSRSRSMYVGCM